MHDDPAHRVPAGVCVRHPRVASTGTHIERYGYRTLGDSRAVALNGSRTNDVFFGASVNRRVDWYGAFYAVKSKEPTLAFVCSPDSRVSLIDHSQV